MNKRFVTLLLMMFFGGCGNDSDYQTILSKYILDINKKRLEIEYNARGTMKKDQILPLLDTIIKQLEKTGNLSDDVVYDIYSHVHNWKNDKPYNPPTTYNTLNQKKELFNKRKLSKIGMLDYIDKFFLFNYSINWRLYNDSFHKVETLLSMDTLYLKENQFYEFKIQIQYNDMPSIDILSNTLQGSSRANKIRFMTSTFSKKLNKLFFNVKAINKASDQIYTLRDSIQYFTVKSYGER